MHDTTQAGHPPDPGAAAPQAHIVDLGEALARADRAARSPTPSAIHPPDPGVRSGGIIKPEGPKRLTFTLTPAAAGKILHAFSEALTYGRASAEEVEIGGELLTVDVEINAEPAASHPPDPGAIHPPDPG